MARAAATESVDVTPTVTKARAGRRRFVTVERVVDDAELAELLQPRTSPIKERATGDGRFVLDEGPFEYYLRTVTVTATDLATGPGPYGGSPRHRVVQHTEYELALSIWSGMFVPLINRAIIDPPPHGKSLWWAPPDVLDVRAARSLSLLCIFSMFAGYLGVLLSQTNTYFKEDFGASSQAIGLVLTGVRAAGLLALVIMAFADRRGRRAVLLFATYAGIALAMAGAFAPNLIFLGTTQTMARACSAAIGLLVAIMAAEEMPANSRSFSVSVLSMTGALGAGGVVMFLKIADLAPWAWRVFYLVPLLMVIPTHRLGLRLPETRRFEVLEAQEELGAPSPGASPHSHVRRFVVLAASAFLLQMFFAPASSFMNDFLREERGYDGLRISLMQIITNLPGGLSIVVGGMLADRYGRRIVGGIGLGAGALFTVLMYSATGWPLWLYSTFGTLLGAMAIPALGVYGPELFPTGSRGKAGGGLGVLSVVGSAIGLIVAGTIFDNSGSYSPAIALLGIAPMLVVVIVVLFYPETAHRSLEELNPEDAPPPPLAELEAIERDLEQAHQRFGHHLHPGEIYRHHGEPPGDGPDQTDRAPA